jgi:hypothetical protein
MPARRLDLAKEPTPMPPRRLDLLRDTHQCLHVDWIY